LKNQRVDYEYRTWSKKRIVIIIALSIAYGTWFNAIDSFAYCPHDVKDCVSIGKMFGGNNIYQIWNILGHFTPGLFMLFWFKPYKIELFLAGFLISTIVMDSPLWGEERLLIHHIPLWDGKNEVPFPEQNDNTNCVKHSNTDKIEGWIAFYYNPTGTDLVWDCPWPFAAYPDFPNAAAIFWSLFGRILAVVLLICYQQRVEARGEYFSLKKLFIKK
jgi:hypothetical protein